MPRCLFRLHPQPLVQLAGFVLLLVGTIICARVPVYCPYAHADCANESTITARPLCLCEEAPAELCRCSRLVSLS